MKMTCILCGVLLCGLAGAQTLKIADNGKSDYVIVIPDKPVTVLQNAANELASHLKQVTGSDYAIFEAAKRPKGKPAFVIGEAGKAAFPEVDLTKAKADTTAIRFKDGDVYLNGRMPRGPLYAVYTFLEDYVGVRWWTPTESYIPQKPTLVVDTKEYMYSPQIVSREPFYRHAVDTTWAPRLKANGHHQKISDDWGGSMSIIGWCHTFFQFLPPEKYFKDHPEWYSMIKGKRTANWTQLCLTNEEMTKEFAKVCLEQIRKKPTAGVISVSQNDWHGRCECPKCLEVEKIEGSQSGPLIRFVNAVAKEIEKEYPEFLIETLAYTYTRTAPKVTKPAKNVVIRLCSIEMNFAQPLETGPANKSFRKDIEDWCAVAPNLYIWNYITNFTNYMLPQPNWRGLAPDLRFFANHHAIGVFEQGDIACNVGDFVRPRAWLVAHLLWNPNQDEKALMREYFNGYYGAAGPFLLQYIDFLCDRVEETKYNLRCYNGSVAGWLPLESLDDALALYKLAEDAVKDDPVLAERVRRERLSLDLAVLQAYPTASVWKRYTGKDYLKNLPKPAKELAIEFDTLCKKYDVGNIREGGAYGDYGKRLLESLERPDFETTRGNPPEWLKGLPDNRWDHFTGRRFQLHQEGNWVKLVDDKEATTGKAAMMTNTHTQWATQVPVGGYYGMTKKWKFRYAVRCDAKPTAGHVLQFGIYSQTLGRDLTHRDFTAQEIAGEKYHVYETDWITLGYDQYVWFAPIVKDPKDATAVYIDYVSMMREE